MKYKKIDKKSLLFNLLGCSKNNCKDIANWLSSNKEIALCDKHYKLCGNA